MVGGKAFGLGRRSVGASIIINFQCEIGIQSVISPTSQFLRSARGHESQHAPNPEGLVASSTTVDLQEVSRLWRADDRLEANPTHLWLNCDLKFFGLLLALRPGSARLRPCN